MDFKTLKTFHKIVACGSFNRAAEELNYAQSTVTMQIKSSRKTSAFVCSRGENIPSD